MDISKLMKQAQQMQGNMKKAEEELSKKEYEAKSSGDLIRVVVSGDLIIKSIEINDELVDVENKDYLSDMLIITVNDALKLAKDDKEKVMGSLTGGLKLPGM
ncbi:MAG: YbaB/EbfC family nucleoid-associated protein [Anaerorhabdus sp.]